MPKRSEDERVLRMLHMRDHLGMSLKGIAETEGLTKSAVAGAVQRIDAANALHPETVGDGTMPPLWWRQRGAAR
jgi:predicted transcriptional regulator